MIEPKPSAVPVAEYSYRHEAEFAAGLLEDAGIAFRLQIDDAGGADIGVTIGRPAVLWVRAEDAPRARDVLDTGLESPDRSGEPRPAGRPSGARGSGTRLSAVERVVAALLGVALVGIGAVVADVGGVWTATCWLMGSVLIVSGASGRTAGPIKAGLRALSGGAP